MFDFLVIGGGIAGVSAAARLSELGRVHLVEAEDNLAYHASGRSAAMYEENYGAPAVCALNKASRHHHETAYGGVLSPRGILLLANPGQEDSFADDISTFGMTEITPSEARGMVPILQEGITRAGFHGAAQDLDTDKLVQGFLSDLKQQCGTVQTRAQVRAIDRIKTGWRVTAGGQDICAHTVVNAAGAWADQIAKMAGIPPIGLTPLRRSVARIAAPGGHNVAPWPMMFGPGEAWYAKPDAGALIVSPANETPSAPMDAWAEEMELAEGLALYQDYVTEPVTKPISSWAGLRTFAPDRNLVLGPASQDPSFIWCAGQGGYGFQTAPAASQLVADLIAGRPSDIDTQSRAALHPARFA